MRANTPGRYYIMSKIKNQKIYIILIIVALLVLGIGIFFIIFPVSKIQDLRSLSNDSYNSIFVSMYSIENYSEESFSEYRGLNTKITGFEVRTVKELTAYLDCAFNSGNIIDTVYIGLDPYTLYKSGATTEGEMAAEMSGLFDYIIQHPDVTFEVLLPSPSMEYWIALDAEDADNALLSYQYVISCMAPHTNAICHFCGDREWLVMNPYNYSGEFAQNPLISEKIMLFAFCDGEFEVNVTDASGHLDTLRNMIVISRTNPAPYPDLSDKTIVFFGDSILGLDYGSYSIPGVIHGLTGADFYNYAIGGTTGCDSDTATDKDNSFTDQMDKFLSHADFYTGDNTQFPYDKISDENLVFVINYGFNDYLRCYAPDDLYQALSTEITRLKSEYPEAQIIIMVPHENVYAGTGTPAPNESDIYLTEYADAARQLAADQGLTLLDVPAIVEVDSSNHRDYFRDGCHYNEPGRFSMAQHIINAVEYD